MKNSVFSNYKVFTGNSHPELAEEIASIIAAVLKNPEDKAVQEDARKRVDALTAAYPLY